MSPPANLAPGVTLAQVCDTKDPKGMGRIKVSFNVAGQSLESDWVPVMSLFAGPDTGAFFLPAVGDSALVAFGDGDPNQPYVLGFLWNGKLNPPVEQAKQQDVRVIRTKKGKVLTFNDSNSGELTLSDEKGNTIRIDTAGNSIAVDSQGDVTITAKGKVTIKGASVHLTNTGGSVTADLNAAQMQMNGAQSIRLKAAMIDLN